MRVQDDSSSTARRARAMAGRTLPRLIPAIIGLHAAAAAETAAQEPAIRFLPVAEIAFDSARGTGTGVAAADYDNDGDIDLCVPTAGTTAPLLLRNDGNGNFEDVAAVSGLAGGISARAALWLDGDADGRLDLLLAGDTLDSAAGADLLRWYVQGDDARFDDRTAEAGLDARWIRDAGRHLGGMCAGDVNNDGYPDIYITLWHGGALLCLNRRNGTFADVTSISGLDHPAASWQPMMLDLDGDGWRDLYEARDVAPNALWQNQRDLSFRDTAFAAAADNAMNDMGITFGDVDNDGDFDLYATTIERSIEHGVLLRNVSGRPRLRFSEEARAAGVAGCGWGWGCTFLDADSDGWLDLALTNGWKDAPHDRDPSRLYRNATSVLPAGGNLRFTDVSVASGFDDTFWGSSLIAADIDNDGDADLVQTCIDRPDGSRARLRILRNASTPGDAGFLKVRPRMRAANRFALGAVVRIEDSVGMSQCRVLTAGTSFLGQEPCEAVFGLGEGAHRLTIHIEWPDGTASHWKDVAPNQTLTIMSQRPERFAGMTRGGDHGELRLHWHGGVLEEWDGRAGPAAGRWLRVSRPANPFSVPVDAGTRFFRVRDEF